MDARSISIIVAGLAALLLAESAVAQSASSRQRERDRQTVSLYDTRSDVRAFNRRLREASTDMEKVDAIVDLSTLYLEVISDPRWVRSPRLQNLRGQIGMKLRKAQRDLIREMKQADDADRSNESRFASAANTGDEESQRELQSAVIDRHWHLLAHAHGAAGPSLYYSSGLHGTSGHFFRGHRGGLPDDNGDELVDLIETILHPDFWDVAGGPGKVYYYRPLRILVIRATTRIHENIENLLERLR